MSDETTGEVTTVFRSGECQRVGREPWMTAVVDERADWRSLADSLAKETALATAPSAEPKPAPSTNRAKSRKQGEINTTSFL